MYRWLNSTKNTIWVKTCKIFDLSAISKHIVYIFGNWEAIYQFYFINILIVSYFLLHCYQLYIYNFQGNSKKIHIQSDVGANSCQDFMFQCRTGECIWDSERCDNHTDCMDNSDETSCLHNSMYFAKQKVILYIS